MFSNKPPEGVGGNPNSRFLIPEAGADEARAIDEGVVGGDLAGFAGDMHCGRSAGGSPIVFL